MSNRRDCPYCGFSYADVKQGREYLYHTEEECELTALRQLADRLIELDSHYAESDERSACLEDLSIAAKSLRK